METQQNNTEIKFDDATHTYTRNNSNYTSVTTILSKYGISPAYSNIPDTVLQAAATRGTAVHAALEQYVLTKTDNGLLPEVTNFANYMAHHNIDLNLATPEKVIYDDRYKVAGTLDLCYYDEDGILTIADHKTTSTLHFDSVTWQLSIYNFIYSKGDVTQYYTTNLKVFHYTKNGLFDVRECPVIDYDVVSALLEANLNNVPTFNVPQLGTQPLSDTKIQVLDTLVQKLSMLDNERKKLVTQIGVFKDEIYRNFTTNNQISWDFGGFKASITKGKTTNTIDKKSLDIFLQCNGKTLDDFTTTVTGKESITLRLNGTKYSNSFENNNGGN